MKQLRARWPFPVFYFLLFLPVGLQTPYLSLFFKRQGFTDSQLGTLAAVAPLMSVLLPPVWGAIADALGDRRRVLAALLVIGALCFPWLMWSKTFATTFAVLALFSAFSNAPASISDAIALEHLEKTQGDYGRLRLWGSLGFATPLLVLGFVLKRGAQQVAASLAPVFFGYTITRLLSAAWVGALPPSRGHGERRLKLHGLRSFATPAFLAIALCTVASSAAMSGYYLYFSIYLDRVGIPDNLKGYYWVLGVASETMMMLVIGRVIARIGLKWTFTLGILGGGIRLFAFSFALPPAGIAAVQLLHALTMTAFGVSGIMFVSRLTSPRLRATGQTLWTCLTQGLGSATGSKLAGLAVGAWGLSTMYRCFALISLTALLGAILFVREPVRELVAAETRE